MPHTALALDLAALFVIRRAIARLVIRGQFGIAVRSHINLSIGHHQRVIGSIVLVVAGAMGGVASAMLSVGSAVHGRRPRHPRLEAQEDQ